MLQTKTDTRVVRFNDHVTTVDDTYCLTLPCRYATTTSPHGGLTVTAHMTETEARALLTDLQDALK